MATHRYWRLEIDRSVNNSALSLAELIMAEYQGGPDVCSGGTPAASSTLNPYSPSYLFNGVGSDFWHANVVASQWISYDFGAGNLRDVREVRLYNRAGQTTQAPLNFELKYSDDNSTWTSASINASSINWWVDYNPQMFRSPVCSPANINEHLLWKITAVSSASTSAAEIGLYETPGGPNVVSGQHIAYASHVFASAYAGEYAFDADSSTLWAGTQTSGWIYIVLPQARNLSEMHWQSRIDATYYQNPYAGYVAYSDDNSAWTTVFSWVGDTWPNSPIQTHTYTWTTSGAGSSGGSPYFSASRNFPNHNARIFPNASPIRQQFKP